MEYNKQDLEDQIQIKKEKIEECRINENIRSVISNLKDILEIYDILNKNGYKYDEIDEEMCKRKLHTLLEIQDKLRYGLDYKREEGNEEEGQKEENGEER